MTLLLPVFRAVGDCVPVITACVVMVFDTDIWRMNPGDLISSDLCAASPLRLYFILIQYFCLCAKDLGSKLLE